MMRRPPRLTRWPGYLAAALIATACHSEPAPSDLPLADDEPVPFVDLSASLPLPDNYGDYGVLWADFDNDDRADLLFMGHGHFPLLLQQQPSGGFRDVSATNGLRRGDWEYPQQRDRHGASCADMDQDGNLDLFVTHGAMRGETLGIKYDELLRGNGDLTFTDVSRAAGSLNPQGRGRHGVWGDIDADGWLDLLVANYQSPAAMYRSNGDGSFTDITDQSGLGVNAFRAAWSDFDQDGDIDVLLASPVRLMRNDGQGVFADVTLEQLGETDRFAYGLAWSDLDGDGDQDIIISALAQAPQAYLNQGEYFLRADDTLLAPPPGTRTTGITPADIDNDGDMDILSNTSAGILVYRNLGDLRFRQSVLAPRSVDPGAYTHGDIAVADYDNDGWLDFATDDPEGYQLFRNASQGSAHWLRIIFTGEAGRSAGNGNRGFGNKVWVTVDDQLIAYREYHGAAAGLRSFGCSALQLGLGEHATVDVRVRWPDGHEAVLSSASANQILRVER